MQNYLVEKLYQIIIIAFCITNIESATAIKAPRISIISGNPDNTSKEIMHPLLLNGRDMNTQVFFNLMRNIAPKYSREYYLQNIFISDAMYRIFIYTKAVAEGNLIAKDTSIGQAQYELGACYQIGMGTKKDEEQALEYYKKAAVNKYVEAEKMINKSYLSEDTDATTIFIYLSTTKQDKKWLAENYYKLGYCYQNGIGTEKDQEKAFECYIEAAKTEFLAEKYILPDPKSSKIHRDKILSTYYNQKYSTPSASDK